MAMMNSIFKLFGCGCGTTAFPSLGSLPDDAGDISITVLEAKNIQAGVQPFVSILPNNGIVHSGGIDSTVAVNQKTANPVWNETLTVKCNCRLYQLKFAVIDSVNANTLGVASLAAESLLDGTENDRWLRLKSPSGQNIRSELHVLATATIPWNLIFADQTILLSPASVIHIGIGWQLRKHHQNEALDVMVYCLQADGRIIDRLYFANACIFDEALRMRGEAQGEEDDEAIRIDMNKIPSAVSVLAFVLQTRKYEPLNSIKAAYVRLRSKEDGNLGYYRPSLPLQEETSALIIGTMERGAKAHSDNATASSPLIATSPSFESAAEESFLRRMSSSSSSASASAFAFRALCNPCASNSAVALVRMLKDMEILSSKTEK